MIAAAPTGLHSNRGRDHHPPVGSHDGLHDRSAMLVSGPGGRQGLRGFVVKNEVTNGVARPHAALVGRRPTPVTIIST